MVSLPRSDVDWSRHTLVRMILLVQTTVIAVLGLGFIILSFVGLVKSDAGKQLLGLIFFIGLGIFASGLLGLLGLTKYNYLLYIYFIYVLSLTILVLCIAAYALTHKQDIEASLYSSAQENWQEWWDQIPSSVIEEFKDQCMPDGEGNGNREAAECQCSETEVTQECWDYVKDFFFSGNNLTITSISLVSFVLFFVITLILIERVVGLHEIIKQTQMTFNLIILVVGLGVIILAATAYATFVTDVGNTMATISLLVGIFVLVTALISIIGQMTENKLLQMISIVLEIVMGLALLVFSFLCFTQRASVLEELNGEDQTYYYAWAAENENLQLKYNRTFQYCLDFQDKLITDEADPQAASIECAALLQDSLLDEGWDAFQSRVVSAMDFAAYFCLFAFGFTIAAGMASLYVVRTESEMM